jgi:two-component system cell cycle response regulator DivK
MAKILYVEDNEDNVYMLASRLKRKGHEVIVATDGRQGVALALAEAPALILMDLSLPVVDDWEATRRLKALPETRDIPVIAISAHAMASDRDSAIRVGCDDFDTNPIQFDRLLRKIEQLLPRSRDDERCRT